MEVTLDSIIEEIDEKKSEEKEAKKVNDEKEKKLLDAGQDIRERALKRHHTASPETETPKKKIKKQAATIDLDGDRELKFMEEEARHRRDTDKKRLELEERRIALAEETQKAQMELMKALINKLK